MGERERGEREGDLIEYRPPAPFIAQKVGGGVGFFFKSYTCIHILRLPCSSAKPFASKRPLS